MAREAASAWSFVNDAGVFQPQLRVRYARNARKRTVGKAFIFAANRPATKTFGGFMKQVVQRVFHGDTVALVASLFESRRPTKTEVDQLQELLDELRKKEKQ